MIYRAEAAGDGLVFSRFRLFFFLSLSPFFVLFEAGPEGLKLGTGDAGLFTAAGGVCAGCCFTAGVVRAAAGVVGNVFATVAFGDGFATGVARGEMETAGVGNGGGFFVARALRCSSILCCCGAFSSTRAFSFRAFFISPSVSLVSFCKTDALGDGVVLIPGATTADGCGFIFARSGKYRTGVSAG